MLDLKSLPLAELAGPALLAGAAWYGVNYLWLPPAVSARLADKTYVPICEANLSTLQAKKLEDFEARKAEIEARRAKILAEAKATRDAAMHAANQARATTNLVLGGPLGKLMDSMSPTGNVREDLESLIPTLPKVDPEALNLPVLPKPFPTPTADESLGYCGCIVDLGLATHRAQFAGYTASLTSYTPEAVAGFEDVLASLIQGRACGGAPGA